MHEECFECPHFAFEFQWVNDALLGERIDVLHQNLHIMPGVGQLGLKLYQFSNQLAIEVTLAVFYAGSAVLRPL